MDEEYKQYYPEIYSDMNISKPEYETESKIVYTRHQQRIKIYKNSRYIEFVSLYWGEEPGYISVENGRLALINLKRKTKSLLSIKKSEEIYKWIWQ